MWGVAPVAAAGVAGVAGVAAAGRLTEQIRAACCRVHSIWSECTHHTLAWALQAPTHHLLGVSSKDVLLRMHNHTSLLAHGIDDARMAVPSGCGADATCHIQKFTPLSVPYPAATPLGNN